MKNSLLFTGIFVVLLLGCKKQNNPNYISKIVGVYTVKKIDKSIDSAGNISYQNDSGFMEINSMNNTSITNWWISESSNIIYVGAYYASLDLIFTNTINKTLHFGSNRTGFKIDSLIFNYEKYNFIEYEYDTSGFKYLITQITGTKN